MNHAGYASFGSQTIFGRFFLPATGAYRLVPTMTTGCDPTSVSFTVPNDATLIGTSTGFQALTRSIASSSGAAFSNPILAPIVD
ncbi:MAG: hypothetical protein AAF726_11250 [Planctomycetota bacterium]